jgi:hypothetical protein
MKMGTVMLIRMREKHLLFVVENKKKQIPRADYSKVPITAKSSSGDRHLALLGMHRRAFFISPLSVSVTVSAVALPVRRNWGSCPLVGIRLNRSGIKDGQSFNS